MKIRKETSQDHQAVYDINRAAFRQAEEGDIVNTLRAGCDDVLSLVAVDVEQVVGHIFFSPAVIASGRQTITGMGLAPMAVHPDRQRQGIGSALVRSGVDYLEKSKSPFIIVLGHPQFYPRFGFETAGRYDIQCQWEVPEEAFMIRILDTQIMDGVTGVATYRQEFDIAM